MKIKSPKILKSLLGYFLKHRHPDSVLADYEEEYYQIVRTNKTITAKLWLLFQIIIVIPSFIKNSLYWSFSMFINYLKTTVRTIKRYKLYSLINITGLTLGLACSLLLLLWIIDELSYDGFHENADRIFRIVQERETDRIFITPSTPAPLGPELQKEFPEIKSFLRICSAGLGFRYGENKDRIYDERGFYADESFFKIFSFPLLKGNKEKVLTDPSSVVISEKMAVLFFGKDNPIGKHLITSEGEVLHVSGVLKGFQGKSHLKFNYIVSNEFLKRSGRLFDRWNYSDSITYILLRKGANFRDVNKKCENAVLKHTPGFSSRLIFQPLKIIYLRPLDGGGPMQYVYIFSALIVIIILISCINFMNLATALSAKRSCEVGMRKVLGADRKSLVFQFLSESALFTVLSLIFALSLILISLPVFNRYSGNNITFNLLQNPVTLFLLAGITVFTALVSGIYPAFFLSSLQPVKTLKGVLKTAGTVFSLRKALVVLQFFISIVLIICAITVSRQIYYVKNKDIGFDRHNLIYVELGEKSRTKSEIIKHELKKNSAVENVTFTNSPFTWLGLETSSVKWEGQKDNEKVNVQLRTVDFDYLKTFKMNMSEGRFFSGDVSADRTSNYILNEAAVNAMGIKNPVGKWFEYGKRRGEIIGVVKNFHHHSMHDKIEPLVFFVAPEWSFYTFLRVKHGMESQAIQTLKDKWNIINPGRSFKYYFLDESIKNLYKTEQNFGSIINGFALFAVFISCLGLFGLAAFTVEQRTKEIGIRKVLGASVSKIILKLSGEFAKWVLAANIFAWPAAFYFINRWLAGFAYKTGISVWIFFSAGMLAIFIAVLTVIFQSIKAATANPVESLRNE